MLHRIPCSASIRRCILHSYLPAHVVGERRAHPATRPAGVTHPLGLPVQPPLPHEFPRPPEAHPKLLRNHPQWLTPAVIGAKKLPP